MENEVFGSVNKIYFYIAKTPKCNLGSLGGKSVFAIAVKMFL
jgi:hypothetical protein